MLLQRRLWAGLSALCLILAGLAGCGRCSPASFSINERPRFGRTAGDFDPPERNDLYPPSFRQLLRDQRAACRKITGLEDLAGYEIQQIYRKIGGDLEPNERIVQWLDRTEEIMDCTGETVQTATVTRVLEVFNPNRNADTVAYVTCNPGVIVAGTAARFRVKHEARVAVVDLGDERIDPAIRRIALAPFNGAEARENARILALLRGPGPPNLTLDTSQSPICQEGDSSSACQQRLGRSRLPREVEQCARIRWQHDYQLDGCPTKMTENGRRHFLRVRFQDGRPSTGNSRFGGD